MKGPKYVKDFDFNEKPCNYSYGGDVKMASGGYYAKGGKVSKMVKKESVATPTMRKEESVRRVSVKAPARKSVPVAPSQPILSRLAAAAAPEAPMGLKKGGMAKVGKVMGEFKAGELHSGSKKGPAVTSRKQAVAIALSEARKGKKG
jgi:hypothetical protein